MVKAGFSIFLKRASVALRRDKSLNGRLKGKKQVDANSAVLEAVVRAREFEGRAKYRLYQPGSERRVVGSWWNGLSKTGCEVTSRGAVGRSTQAMRSTWDDNGQGTCDDEGVPAST
jgi:hypothetical protein